MEGVAKRVHMVQETSVHLFSAPGPETGRLIAGLVAWGATRVRPLEVLRYEEA